MADKKISQLTSLAQGDIATTTDVLAIVDTSATETKKATPAAIVGAAAAAGLTNVDINSGAIDGTTIGANSAAAGTFTNLTASGTVSFSGATVSNGGSVTTVDINGGTIDGASVGASSASTGAFTTLTTSSTVTLNGGTANGVLYLNGSKVATSGSALTFNGSNLSVASGNLFVPSGVVTIGDTTSGKYLEIYNGTADAQRIKLSMSGTDGVFQVTRSSGTTPNFIFQQDSTELMRLTSTGLGIGTSSPSAKLSISGGNVFVDNANGSVIIRNADGTNQQQIRLRMASNDGVLDVTRASGTAPNLIFGTEGSEKMRLTDGGNLGIGTSSPTNYGATYKTLAVNGSSTGIVDVMQNGTVYGQLSTEANVYKVEAVGASTVLRLVTNSATRATLDTSGNLGLGVTPSAWQSGAKAVEIGGSGYLAFTGSTNGGYLYSNAYLASGGNTYKATGYAAAYGLGVSGQHLWYTAASGTAGNAISFALAMTLDASGRLGIGTSSPSEKLDVSGGGLGVGNGTIKTIVSYTTEGIVGTTSNHALLLYANNAERARITAGGEVYIAGTTDQGAYNLQVNGTGVWGAGAYVNGSDARLKDNIQSLDSGLDVVKAIRPVTFQYKPEYSKDQSVQPGFIAQELQTAMAGKPYLEGVVQEGPNHLNVAYQNIIPILVKAIQELEAKVAALEAK